MYPGVSNLQPTGHVQPRMAVNAAKHKVLNSLKTLWDFFVLTHYNVCNMWPKITLLPVWHRDAKRLDTSGNLLNLFHISEYVVTSIFYYWQSNNEHPWWWNLVCLYYFYLVNEIVKSITYTNYNHWSTDECAGFPAALPIWILFLFLFTANLGKNDISLLWFVVPHY